jgi:hypothetical protein
LTKHRHSTHPPLAAKVHECKRPARLRPHIPSPQHISTRGNAHPRFPQRCTAFSALPQTINSPHCLFHCAYDDSPSNSSEPTNVRTRHSRKRRFPPLARSRGNRIHQLFTLPSFPHVENRDPTPHLGRHCWGYNIWCFPLDRYNGRE